MKADDNNVLRVTRSFPLSTKIKVAAERREKQITTPKYQKFETGIDTAQVVKNSAERHHKKSNKI